MLSVISEVTFIHGLSNTNRGQIEFPNLVSKKPQLSTVDYCGKKIAG